MQRQRNGVENRKSKFLLKDSFLDDQKTAQSIQQYIEQLHRKADDRERNCSGSRSVWRSGKRINRMWNGQMVTKFSIARTDKSFVWGESWACSMHLGHTVMHGINCSRNWPNERVLLQLQFLSFCRTEFGSHEEWISSSLPLCRWVWVLRNRLLIRRPI